MTISLPDWMIDDLTAHGYDALPEDVRRGIEVLDGHVVVRPAQGAAHDTITRRLAEAFESARPRRFAVATQMELRLRDTLLVNRRPDIVLHVPSPDGAEALRPHHCRLVIEVMTFSSITADRLHKPAEYAAAGIERFWRVETRGDLLSVFRYRLDPTTREYTSAGVTTGSGGDPGFLRRLALLG